MSLDAMKQALEALNKCQDWPGAYEECSRAITALRAAIEQAQEPVAWVYPEGLEALKSGRPWTAYGSNGGGRIPLYLSDAVARRVEPRSGESGAGFESLPASPQWQGLTDAERAQFRRWAHPDMIEAIELRLQERNT